VRIVSRFIQPTKTEEAVIVVYETHGVTFEKNLKVCMSCGIGNPKAESISKLPWASPEFIQAHVDSLYADQSIGLAILRIENNELPRIWMDQIKTIPKPAEQDDEEGE
jgi:hypothetical protein